MKRLVRSTVGLGGGCSGVRGGRLAELALYTPAPSAFQPVTHEPDEDGAKSEVIADKEPCKAFNTRALEAAKGKIALTPTYLKYLNLPPGDA